MTDAAPRGKSDAGNPHVAPTPSYGGTGRFDEGEVAPAKPMRGSLLYKGLDLLRILPVALAGLMGAPSLPAASPAFIGVSETDSRYFQTCEGKTWIPIGCNICFDRLQSCSEKTRSLYDGWMTKFAANGGNFMRVWCSLEFLDIMSREAFVFDPEAEENLKWLVARTEQLGIRLKLTLEHFRGMNDVKTEFRQDVPGVISFKKGVYAPYAKTVTELFKSDKCLEIYLAKARRMAELIGDSPAVVAIETWNEINSVGCTTDEWVAWSEKVNPPLQKIFPRQMILTNLGSFSGPGFFAPQTELAKLSVNAYNQVHRYRDPGAELDVCRGPMDVLCADAIRELLDRSVSKPAILAETGAVEHNHCTFSHLYALDKEGLMLHDEIFAAFFAGSAGSGQPWHWDHQYISQHGLWHHFKWFAKAIEGLDPAAEHFRPFHTETHRCRLWGLRGEKTSVVWLRDKEDVIEWTLGRELKTSSVTGETLPGPLTATGYRWYLPWDDGRVLETHDRKVPVFHHSAVVRFQVKHSNQGGSK